MTAKPPPQKDQTARIITRLAGLIALVVSLCIPLGYWLTASSAASEALAFKAKVKASALNGLIASTPDLWMFAENRMQGLISREPVPLDGEYVQIFDALGNTLVDTGKIPASPLMSRSQPLFDSGRMVGRLSVSASQQPLLYNTMLAGAIGLLLGALVFLSMRTLPLRALRQANQDLLEEKERAETTLRSISDAVITSDANGCLKDLNPAGLAMFEVEKLEQIAGRRMIDLIAPEYRAIYTKHHDLLVAGETVQLRYEIIGLKGSRRWLETHSVPQQVQGEQLYLAVARDITERKAAEDEIRNLAFHDHLTGIPNRRLLIDHLRRAIASSTRCQRYGALLVIDMDNFKTLNDTLGHDYGDLLLQQVARRLSASVRENDTVARLGGDEFVVLLEDLSESASEATRQVEMVGKKILGSLNKNYLLNDQNYRSTPSIGVTLFANHQGSSDELLKRADLAMYQAKSAGRNTLRFFDPAMQEEVMARAELESSLQEAIQKNQFILHYQPQVLSDGHIFGAEALVRWQHPERGMVPPGEFIELAEESGLILPLGRWVMEAACQQQVAWALRPELSHLSISVNVSARQFRQPNFVDEVLAILKRTGANPHRLKIELTESLLVKDVDDIVAKMTTLKAYGVGFSLDDFGTGYSSLSYIKRLPLDQLKIDQSFVRDILDDPNDAAIAKMVVALAESMGLAVIAEGVESEAQSEFLARLGCHAYQGYLFSRPLPTEDFAALAIQAA